MKTTTPHNSFLFSYSARIMALPKAAAADPAMSIEICRFKPGESLTHNVYRAKTRGLEDGWDVWVETAQKESQLLGQRRWKPPKRDPRHDENGRRKNAVERIDSLALVFRPSDVQEIQLARRMQ